MNNYHVVAPAYGKDYKSATAAKEAFKSGLDFRYRGLSGGSYCSIRDFKPGETVEIRYNKLLKLTILSL